MSPLEPLQLQARYNRWMNQRLLDAAEKLPEAERFADRGAFFASIGGTLMHLVVADSIWLRRFAAADCARPLRDADDWLPRPSTLNQRLFDDWAALRAMRERIDPLIETWIGALVGADLDEVLTYRNMRGEPFRRRLGPLLVHFFNHQTHHRGQASTLLFQAGVDPGVTDLLMLLPLEPGTTAA